MISSNLPDNLRRAAERPPTLRQPGSGANNRPETAQKHAAIAQDREPPPKLVAANVAKKKQRRHENYTDPELPNAKPERHQAPTLGATAQGEAKSLPRVTVRFTGYRVRPLDPDNFAGSTKDLLDGLRHAGLILGDEPWRIILETGQVKVATFKEEKTVIEIEGVVWHEEQLERQEGR